MERDSLIFGIIVGLLVPIGGYFLWLGINQIMFNMGLTDKDGEIFQFSQQLSYLISICTNLIAVQYFKRRRMDKALRGTITVTMILVFVWAFYFKVL